MRVILASASLAIGSAASAAVIHKDITNPTGVPDIWQGNTAHCEAAAWGDAVWWFDQHRPGLVNTAQAGWYARSQGLFSALEQTIYGRRRGASGTLLYVHGKRPADFSPAPHPRRKNQRVIQSTWSIQHHNYTGADVEAQAAATLGNDHRFAVLGAFLHQQGDAANDFKVPLAGSADEGLWGHALAYAGRETNATGALTHLPLSHGWAPSHQGNAKPVDSAYYNRYSVDQVNTGIPGLHPSHLRITDAAFFGSAGGLKPGTVIDHASVTTTSVLRDDHQTFYSFTYFQPPPAPAPKAAQPSASPFTVMSNALENAGEGPIFEWAFELPLLDAPGKHWQAGITPYFIPPGWTWEFWDPNQTPYMTPLILNDEDGLLERGYRGIRLFTDSNPLLDGETLLAEFGVDPAYVDLSADILAYAIGDQSRHYFAESLGLRLLPAPGTVTLVLMGLLGAAGCGKKRPR